MQLHSSSDQIKHKTQLGEGMLIIKTSNLYKEAQA
jgi:hypothetical protein